MGVVDGGKRVSREQMCKESMYAKGDCEGGRQRELAINPMLEIPNSGQPVDRCASPIWLPESCFQKYSPGPQHKLSLQPILSAVPWPAKDICVGS